MHRRLLKACGGGIDEAPGTFVSMDYTAYDLRLFVEQFGTQPTNTIYEGHPEQIRHTMAKSPIFNHTLTKTNHEIYLWTKTVMTSIPVGVWPKPWILEGVVMNIESNKDDNLPKKMLM